MSVCEEGNPEAEDNDVVSRSPIGRKKKRGESRQKVARGLGGLNFQTVQSLEAPRIVSAFVHDR